MIEEMKKQIEHLDNTFDYNNIGDYKDLLYVIYLNWIENNGENEDVNNLINSLIEKVINFDNKAKKDTCNDCQCEDNSSDNCSFKLYKYFLGEKIRGVPKIY